MESIYVITTFEQLNINTDKLNLGINTDPSELGLEFGDIRIVGWYKDLSVAENKVESNACDINEGCYEWAIIEEVPEGLYPYGFENIRKLYRFNKTTGKYELQNKGLTAIVSWTFSIG